MKVIDTLTVLDEETGDTFTLRQLKGEPFNTSGLAPVTMLDGEPVYSSHDFSDFARFRALLASLPPTPDQEANA